MNYMQGPWEEVLITTVGGDAIVTGKLSRGLNGKTKITTGWRVVSRHLNIRTGDLVALFCSSENGRLQVSVTVVNPHVDV